MVTAVIHSKKNDTIEDDRVSSTTSSTNGASSSDEIQSAMHNTSYDSPSSDSDLEEYNTPLYEGSSLSAKNFKGMFMALTHKHNLSCQAVDSILKLIKMSLPEGNNCPASGYQFEKSLLDLGFKFRKHVTCWKCQHPLEEQICTNDQCINAGIQGKGEESSMFYVIDLLPEIERLISGKVIHDYFYNLMCISRKYPYSHYGENCKLILKETWV